MNIDLEDFFPTIHLGRVRGVFTSPPFNMPPAIATVIGQIACDTDGKLPQGAPTSPIVSNLVCGPLDTSLQRLAQSNGSFYPRYADDMSFSTNRSKFPDDLGHRLPGGTFSVGPHLRSLIVSHGFRINFHKVWLRTSAEHQEVTGLTVNEFPNITRRVIRQTRAILHNWDTTSLGQAAQVFSQKCTSGQPTGEDAFKRFVHGRLSFIGMVRGPDDPVYRRLATKLAFIEKRTPPDSGGAGPAPLRGGQATTSGWQRVYDRLREHLYLLQLDHAQSDEFAADQLGTAFGYERDLLITAGHNLDGFDVRAMDHSLPENGITPIKVKFLNEPHGVDCGLITLPPNSRRGWPGQIPTQERIPQVGEEVATIGYPPRCPAAALVRSLRGDVQFIQVNFRQDPGLSGSPLVDKRGYVLGIVVENALQKPKRTGIDEEASSASTEHGQVLPLGYVHRLRQIDWGSRAGSTLPAPAIPSSE